MNNTLGVSERFAALQENPAFLAKLERVGSGEEVKALFMSYGIEVSLDEAKSMFVFAGIETDDELDETALDNVSGGVVTPMLPTQWRFVFNKLFKRRR